MAKMGQSGQISLGPAVNRMQDQDVLLMDVVWLYYVFINHKMWFVIRPAVQPTGYPGGSKGQQTGDCVPLHAEHRRETSLPCCKYQS